MDDLKRKVEELKRSVRGKKLSTTDRLLLDILSQMTDILISGFREKLNSHKPKRRTSTTSDQGIDNEKELSLRDILQARGRSDRRK